MSGTYRYEFDYGDEVKDVLRQLATDESQVDEAETVEYFEEITTEADPDLREVVIALLALIHRFDEGPGAITDPADSMTDEANDYQDDHPIEDT